MTDDYARDQGWTLLPESSVPEEGGNAGRGLFALHEQLDYLRNGAPRISQSGTDSEGRGEGHKPGIDRGARTIDVTAQADDSCASRKTGERSETRSFEGCTTREAKWQDCEPGCGVAENVDGINGRRSD